MERLTYKKAGVDINKKANFVRDIYPQMKMTFGPRVIENPNGFGGLFALNNDSPSFTRIYKDPVLVSSTDGVGTKLKIAFMMNKHDTIGIDLVAMCVNDVLVLGAELLFFLDYLASSKIMPDRAKEIIKGMVIGCQESDCALLGGETPELPDFYKDDEYDLAGFAVGVVEKERIINGTNIRPGDAVIGLSSSGLHSNGYSLVRRVLLEESKLSLDQYIDDLKTTLGEELLKPTKIYVKAIKNVLNSYKEKNVIKGIAHITGGGMIDNIPRILPRDCSIDIKNGSWPVPTIFSIIRNYGNISEKEMYHVFNMGIGMVLIVEPIDVKSVISILEQSGEEAMVIGKVVSGDRKIHIKRSVSNNYNC